MSSKGMWCNRMLKLSLIAQAVCHQYQVSLCFLQNLKISRGSPGHFLWPLGCLRTQFGNQRIKEPVRHYSRSNQRAAEFSPVDGKEGTTCTLIHSFITQPSMGNLPGTSPFSVVAIYITLISSNAGWLGGLQFYACYWRGTTACP